MPALADEYSDVSQLIRAGKLPEAMGRVEQFLTAQPKDAQMRFLRGVVQGESGKTSDAIATFQRLTEEFPELPEPYNNLAVLYAAQNQYDKARSALEMAIRTNPSYSTAHENLGDVYAKLASQAYNKALQLDSSNQAVGPKLALIRELFTPNVAKFAKAPAPATPVAALPATKPVPPAPAPVAVAPPPPAAAKPAVPTAPPAAAPTNNTSATATAPSTAPAAPAAAKPAVAAQPEPSANTGAVKEVESAVNAWANAWSGKDVRGYLGSYGKEFDPPGKLSRSAWEAERKDRITSKAVITVKISNLDVKVTGNKATARFRQDYKAGGLATSTRKTLELQKTGERWRIVRESVG